MFAEEDDDFLGAHYCKTRGVINAVTFFLSIVDFARVTGCNR